MKRKKIDELKLSEEDWGHVKLFTSLLSHVDNPQQSFFSHKGPTLQHALPALEALHKAWSKHMDAARYEPSQDGLIAATSKIVNYYQHTSDSDAYTLIILLGPSQKDAYFKKYWGAELHAQVLKNLEQLFKEHFIQLYGENGSPSLPKKKLPQLLCELSSDEDEATEEGDHDVDLQSPWLKEFNLYLHSATSIADGLLMPSSVLCGLLFLRIIFPSWHLQSQTITKCCNHLKGDIVEAIQVLRMLYNHNLMFCEPAPSSALELALEEKKEGGLSVGLDAEDLSWILELSDDPDVEA
ncbi:hypothetical protein BS17DRAFT_766779 [Gyrodon lividus]|nr:hypothetical protein BS17DRAFT_766779 [Gyrodon lividus]